MKGENTRYRLAQSMAECMRTTPVESITIRQIVDKCGVTRQTFYRNFIDKYDLINWYFEKLLDKSFEHMGRGKTVFEGLERKFTYIRDEQVLLQIIDTLYSSVLYLNVRTSCSLSILYTF